MPETQWNNGINPFAGLVANFGVAGTDKPKKRNASGPKPSMSKPKRTITPGNHGVPRADVSAMQIEYDMPLPAGRAALADGGMYAELLKRMKPGACIVCKTEEVYAVASAVRAWIKRQGKAKQWSVRTQTKWPEKRGKGRVWCWPEPPPIGESSGKK